MNKRWLELSVGAMMVAGIAALVALALQVSGGSMSRNVGHYPVSALFENAAGLGPKAKVTMAGVTIGEVVAVGIDPVSHIHLRAHETVLDLVCRLLLEKKKYQNAVSYPPLLAPAPHSPIFFHLLLATPPHV